MSYTADQVGIAFAVCVVAGLSTTIGAALVLFRFVQKLDEKPTSSLFVGEAGSGSYPLDLGNAAAFIPQGV